MERVRLRRCAPLLVRTWNETELIVVPSERARHVNDFLCVSTEMRDRLNCGLQSRKFEPLDLQLLQQPFLGGFGKSLAGVVNDRFKHIDEVRLWNTVALREFLGTIPPICRSTDTRHDPLT